MRRDGTGMESAGSKEHVFHLKKSSETTIGAQQQKSNYLSRQPEKLVRANTPTIYPSGEETESADLKELVFYPYNLTYFFHLVIMIIPSFTMSSVRQKSSSEKWFTPTFHLFKSNSILGSPENPSLNSKLQKRFGFQN